MCVRKVVLRRQQGPTAIDHAYALGTYYSSCDVLLISTHEDKILHPLLVCVLRVCGEEPAQAQTH